MPPTSLDFRLDGIAHLLADGQLAVPPFQRPYAWTRENAQDYWSDIKSALDAKVDEYFMGTVVLAEGDDQSLIIDGQQRLATTMLLLAALRDAYAIREDTRRADGLHSRFLTRFDLKTGTHKPRLTLNREDRTFFDQAVVDGIAQSPTFDSHVRLADSQEFLRQRVEEDLAAAGTQWADRIVAWVDFLTDGVKVIVITVPEVADAFVIFETLNDRGAPLTIADLLRNFLMARAEDDDSIAVVEKAWGVALTNLGLVNEEGLFVDFLRHSWSSKRGATREKELFASIRRDVTDRAAVLGFVNDLAHESRTYAALLDAGHEFWTEWPDDAAASVESLLRLELGQYRPLALAVVQCFAQDEATRALRSLVAWAVRGVVAGGIGGGVAERAYCAAAVRIRTRQIRSTDQLLRQLLPIVPSDEIFQVAFARARSSKISVARYLLTSLERLVGEIAKPELAGPGFDTGLRLEYVLPRTADPTDWPGVDEEAIRSLSTRLGNAVLLAEGDQGLGSRRGYSSRRSTLSESSVRLTREAAAAPTWEQATVDRRQEGLARLALLVWPRGPHE